MSADAHLDDSNLLAAYAEGRVSDEERRRVTAHLTECDACRTALAALARGTDDAVTSPRTGAAAIQILKPRFLGLRPAAWLPVAAGLAIATVAGVLLTRTPQPLSNAPAPVPPDPAPTRVPPTPTGTAVPDPSAPSTPPPRPDSRSGDPPAVDPSLLARRGGERRIGDKTFRLVAGEWIDSSYDPLSALPVIEARTAAERDALLGRIPALRPYAALGARVLVVHDGMVYKLGQ